MVVDSSVKRGRVAIGFDDDFVDRWYEAHGMLKKYNWKATFFVSKFRILSAGEIDKLKELQAYGHEIAAHSSRHLAAADYERDFGLEAYMNDEISPMMEMMAKEGFHPTTFAYPYGSSSPTLTERLLKTFKVVRGTGHGNDISPDHRCFQNENNLIFGLGLDHHYGHNMEFYKSLMDIAKQEGKTACFVAHKPVNKIGTGGFIQTPYQRLIEVCEYIQNNGLEFITTEECYVDPK